MAWPRRALFLALLVFVAGRCLVPMDETDLFFNLRLGELVIGTHAVPRTNLLSFTYPDFPESNLAWVFQIALALAHRAAGVRGTVVLKTAFVLATFAVLWRIGRRRGAEPALLAPLLALAAWAAEPRFVERPHLVTFLGLAFALLALERAEAGRPRALFALVLAGFLWANANSCFFLAPALLVLYAAGAALDARRAPELRASARRAALVALALAPIVLATPAGPRALRYIANHFRMPSLRPLQEYRTAAWPLDGPFFFVVALLVVAFAAGRGRARQLLPAAALALLGARRIRFAAETALVAAPAIAAAGSAWLRARRGASAPKPRSFAELAAAAALLLLALAPRVAGARRGEPFFDVGEQRGLVPRDAIRFATERGLRDRMYNDLEVGSYLTWEGWPRYRVFQDPRINSYPDEMHALLRRGDLTRPEWQALMDRFGVTSALITYPGVNPRGALFDPARWALVYRSDEALVFARRQGGWSALIAADELPVTFRYTADEGLTPVPLPAPPAGSPVRACEWSRRLGDHFIESGRPERAYDAYREATAADANCVDPAHREPTARALAALALQFGDAETAARAAEGLSDAPARASRGFALLRLDRAADALGEFDRALALLPDLPDALLGRSLALERVGRPTEALAALRAFLARAPDHPAAASARARLERLSSPAGAGSRAAW